MFSRFCLCAFLIGTALLLQGCVAPGDTPQAKRDHIQRMKTETMPKFYANRSEIEGVVKSSVGYAVFKSFSVGLFPFGGGSGYGVLVDNATGRQTYMQMGMGSLGGIFTVKDWRGLLVFDDPAVMLRFSSETWRCGGAAEAVFNFGEFGAQTNRSGMFGHGVRVYELTENGVSLRAWIPIVKYSPYNKLNTPMATAAPAPMK